MKITSVLLILTCFATFETVSFAQMNDKKTSATLETAVFGGGCFWCLDAQFKLVNGVKSVVSGYAGGSLKNPSYEQVCSETTGHAEVIQVEFDPAVVSYDDLLRKFFRAHDPTTLNRQGGDVGTSYRSIILYKDENQKAIAVKMKAEAQKIRENAARAEAVGRKSGCAASSKISKVWKRFDPLLWTKDAKGLSYRP